MVSEITKLRLSIFWALVVISASIFALIIFYSKSFISIKAVPPTAKVTIDNNVVAVTMGSAKTILKPGEHTLTVEATGYISSSQSINAKRGFNKSVTVSLQKDQVPVLASTSGRFLTRGTDFNNGYYLGDNGSKIYRVKFNLDENGVVQILENIALTDNKLSEIQEMILSPTKELALFRKSDGVYLFDFYKYDFVNQTERKWGDDIGSIAWAPDNSKVAYVYAPLSGERSLIFANLANTEVERVRNLIDDDIENPLIAFAPDSQYMTMIPRNNDKSRNNIYLFDSYSRKLKTITDGGNQTGALFSPDANKILFSSTLSQSGGQEVLSVMDKNGENKKYLGVEAKIDKTTWSPDSKMVLAVTNSGGVDQIVKINTENKQITTIWKQGNGSEIGDLSYLGDGKIMMFETSDGIYAMKTE
ncbi:MAG: PEGA domain-containing protein [Candidatus Berkelbacteria bacterium]